MNFAWAFGTGFLLFYILKHTVGIRVSPEEELVGLYISEHGIITYPDFVYTEPARPTRVVRMSEAVSESGNEPETGGKGGKQRECF